jgi:SAM-dependent methyltransferase
MHDTARTFGEAFFQTYIGERSARILDIGAFDVNGTLRDCAPPRCRYVGVDVAAGPGVDIVVEEGSAYPFPDHDFDAVVSTSALEHDRFFWVTFIEMARVVMPGGYIYVNAPSEGMYHAYPTDNWRFFPDAGLALGAWAERQNVIAELVESFVARKGADGWTDCVMVFRKGPTTAPLPPRRIVDRFLASASNVRRNDGQRIEHLNVTEETPPQKSKRSLLRALGLSR